MNSTAPFSFVSNVLQEAASFCVIVFRAAVVALTLIETALGRTANGQLFPPKGRPQRKSAENVLLASGRAAPEPPATAQPGGGLHPPLSPVASCTPLRLHHIGCSATCCGVGRRQHPAAAQVTSRLASSFLQRLLFSVEPSARHREKNPRYAGRPPASCTTGLSPGCGSTGACRLLPAAPCARQAARYASPPTPHPTSAARAPQPYW